MTLIVRCVICQSKIENPTCYSETCKDLKCQDKYRRYLIWRKRKKAKDYKVVKIIKVKRKTKK